MKETLMPAPLKKFAVTACRVLALRNNPTPRGI
jgi:hypothetical protein